MKTVIITFNLIFGCFISSCQEKPLNFNIGNQTIFPIISAGLAYNPEHGIAFPKVMVSLQSKEDGGFYVGAHVVTALLYSFSKGLHAGIKSKYATIEYSWSGNNLKQGIGANKEGIPYFESSHNINIGLKYNLVWTRLNVPIMFTSKKGNIHEYFKNFVKIKGYPIGFDLLVTDNMREEKKM